jgi:hypothetical protein
MEDNLNFLAKQKTTSIFFCRNERRPQLYSKIEDDPNFWEDNLNLMKMEDGLNFLAKCKTASFLATCLLFEKPDILNFVILANISLKKMIDIYF